MHFVEVFLPQVLPDTSSDPFFLPIVFPAAFFLLSVHSASQNPVRRIPSPHQSLPAVFPKLQCRPQWFHILSVLYMKILICITKISTFLILCDLAVCLATLYVSFSLVFALMRYLQGKVFLIRFYSPTTLSSSRAEFRLPSRLACA